MVATRTAVAGPHEHLAPDAVREVADHPDPDVQLMLRAKAGDELAFAELVTAYLPRLVGMLTHVLRSAEMAEDVAQEVCFRIYQARHAYVPTARFATWVFRIAYNLALNRRRDEGRQKAFQVKVEGLRSKLLDCDLADKSGMMPQRVCDKREMQSIVTAAVDSLNEHQRMVVLLHKFEGLSYSEIALALDMSPPAVKSLLSRARSKLRMKLEPYVTAGELWEATAPGGVTASGL